MLGAAESGGPSEWPKAAPPPSGRGEGSEDAGTPTPMRPLFGNVYNEDEYDDEEEEERDALAFSK